MLNIQLGLTPSIHACWEYAFAENNRVEHRRTNREENPLNLSTAVFNGGTAFMITDDAGEYKEAGFFKDGLRFPTPEINGVLWMHRRCDHTDAELRKFVSGTRAVPQTFGCN